MLSATRFLYRLGEYWFMETLADYKHYCDNKGLLTSVKKGRKYHEYYPTMTTAADWDVIHEIVESMKILKANPTTHHVKGHQDDDKSYDELPLPAQLNIDADALAEKYQSQYHTHDCSWVPMLRGTKAQLNFDSKGTVTNKYNHEVQDAATAPALQKRIKAKNGWSQQQYDSVDWTAHGRAINRYSDRQTTIVKMINDILPTGARVHKYDPKYSHRCPACHSPDEDDQHVMRCPHHDRQQWRKELIAKVKETAQKQTTRPFMAKLLCEGITAWLENRPPDFQDFSPVYQTLIDRQAQIGWHNLLKGRFALEWAHLQEEYLIERNERSSRANGLAWTTNMIDAIWESWLELWTLRNEQRHGSDEFTRARARYEQAAREVSLAYEKRDLVMIQERRLFDTPLEERLQGTAAQLRQWLHTFQTLIDQSANEAAEVAVQGVNSIRDYFDEL